MGFRLAGFTGESNVSSSDSPVDTLRYFVSHNGEVKGPFDLDMIEAFILSGHYPRGVRICAVDSKEWRSYFAAYSDLAGPGVGQIRSVPRCEGGWEDPEMDLYRWRSVCASRARCGLEWDHKRNFDRISPNWICNPQLCSAANV